MQHLDLVIRFIDFLSTSTRSSNKAFIYVVQVYSQLFDGVEKRIHFALQSYLATI